MFQLYGSADQKAQLLDYLREKRLLLVMDNCEHILDGIEVLDEILGAAPCIKILATSRERLNVQGEWLLPRSWFAVPTERERSRRGNLQCHSIVRAERSSRRSRLPP